jgi:hypothetical protein
VPHEPHLSMTASGQTRKSAVAIVRSGLTPKADSTRTSRHVQKRTPGSILLCQWPAPFGDMNVLKVQLWRLAGIRDFQEKAMDPF